MNIRDLIDELESIASEAGDDTEVRLAQQPRWAFEYSIQKIELADMDKGTCEVCDGSGTDDDGENCDNCDGTGFYQDDLDLAGKKIVYIAEGNQIGYLPKAAADALGW
jgi:DnaJ-class molecular chaperone